MFQKPLDFKKSEKNRSRGIDIASALTSSRGNEVGEALCAVPISICGGCADTQCQILGCLGVRTSQCLNGLSRLSIAP